MRAVPITQYLNRVDSNKAGDRERSPASPFRAKLIHSGPAKAAQPWPASGGGRPSEAGDDRRKKVTWPVARAASEVSASANSGIQSAAPFASDDYDRAFGEGYLAAQNEADTRLDARLAQELAAAEQKQAQLANDELDVIRSGLKAGFEAIEHGIAETVSRVLASFIASQKAQEIADELRKAIATLRTSGAIVVHGPERLIQLLQADTQDHTGIQFVCDASDEVTVVAGRGQVETRLQEWSALLTKG